MTKKFEVVAKHFFHEGGRLVARNELVPYFLGFCGEEWQMSKEKAEELIEWLESRPYVTRFGESLAPDYSIREARTIY